MFRLFIIMTVFLTYNTNLQAQTSKEIWLNHIGATTCDPGYCADEIPSVPLDLALKFFKNNAALIENVNYIAIADFRIPSSQKRLFILDLNDGTYDSMLVTHGKKSEGSLGMAEKFSNKNNSKMSSLGFYLTGAFSYEGKHGTSLRLEGLSSTNSNALERGIVIHAARYATESFVRRNNRLGLSYGCPAVAPDKINSVIDKMKGRGLLFIYSDKITLSN